MGDSWECITQSARLTEVIDIQLLGKLSNGSQIYPTTLQQNPHLPFLLDELTTSGIHSWYPLRSNELTPIGENVFRLHFNDEQTSIIPCCLHHPQATAGAMMIHHPQATAGAKADLPPELLQPGYISD